MQYGLTNSTPATVEPVSIIEARKQVELPAGYTAHDAHLLRLVTAARERFEMITGRQVVKATWDLYLDRFPSSSEPIYLPKPPLQSVTSITYLDTAGVSQTWSASDYSYSTHREPGIVTPAYGEAYPSARWQIDSIRVRYVAGYGPSTSAPEGIKAAILLLVGHWFDHREEVNVGNIVQEIPTAAAALMDQYMVGDEFINYSGRCDSYAEAA